MNLARLRPHATLLGLVALAMAGAALYARIFQPGELLGDDLSIHLAEMASMARSLRALDFHLWNPSGNLGFPSAYYYQSLPQLTVVVLHLVTFGQVALLTCFKAVLLASLVGPAVTTAWAWRRAERPLAEALAIGAVLLLLGGKSRWGYGSDSLFITGIFTQTFAFLFFGPAVILGERFLATGKGLGASVGFGLLTGLSHPFLGVVLGFYYVLRRYQRKELGAQLGRLVLLGALLVVASSALWLPILVDYDSFGGFPSRVAFEEGVPPKLFLPSLWKGELVDLNRVPLLTLAGLLGLFVAPARRYTILSIVSAVLIMAGPSIGKTKDDLLPMIRLLAPLEWCHAVSAGVTVVVAAAWCRRVLARRQRWILDGGMLLLAVLALVEGLPRVRTLAARPDVATNAKVARVELDALLPVLGKQPRARLQVSTKLGTGNHYWAYLPSVYQQVPAVAVWGGAALQSSPNFVYVREELEPAEVADLFDAPYLFLRTAGRGPLPGAEMIAQTGNYALQRLPSRGLLIGASIVGTLPADRFERRRANLLWLRSPDARAGRHYEYVGSTLGHNAATFSTVSIEDLPSRYRFVVDVSAAGTVAARISYHPRWRATLDGAPLRLGRVSPDVLAFEVPEGRHTIELRFVRPVWHALLYLVSLLLVVGVAVVERRRAARRG